MQTIYDWAPTIASVVAANEGDIARQQFLSSCLRQDWQSARVIVEHSLANRSELRWQQESRLREFLELLPDR